jgi:cyclophilin family peptidyl-prolyl cis-trans isomerase/HEAT repeat protein
MREYNLTKILVSFIALVVILNSCLPPSKKSNLDESLDFADPTIQKVLTFQNNRQGDSLVAYLTAKDAVVRRIAVNAFASMRDTNYAQKIVPILKDPNFNVRCAAAFTLGQIGDKNTVSDLIAAFVSEDTMDVDNQFNANILEAIGKVGSPIDAENIANVQTYRPNDSLLITGQMLAIYRFGIRGIVPEAGSSIAIKYLNNPSISHTTRLVAAHYLAKAKGLDLTTKADELNKIFKNEDNVDVIMALATALGKTNNLESKNLLINQIYSAADYRLRCNAVRALSNYSSDVAVSDTIQYLIEDKNVHVMNCALEYFEKLKDIKYAPSLLAKLPNIDSKLVRAKLLKTVMNSYPLYLTQIKNSLKDTLITIYTSSTNPYERVELINAIGKDVYQYVNLINLPTKSAFDKIGKVETLNAIINSPDFILAYKGNHIKVKAEVLNYIATLIAEGDGGLVSMAAPILEKAENQAKILVKDSTFIDEAKSKLKLPQDLEGMLAIENLEKYMRGQISTPFEYGKYKDIDFTLLQSLKDTSEMVIKTTKGNIRILLFPKLAPVSVCNFIQLCQSDYYDDKIFHRVVPNFVIQAGCPRGDGYGSLDFLIRSELTQMYYHESGLVGMASAGKDTESSQFFITHSPTPHLDGNYTIFGKVSKGLDVVDEIQIGDKIIDAIMTK